MTDNLRDIYVLNVSLNDVAPSVWRTIRVPSSLDLWQLHIVLQVSMGWTNSHLHQFVVEGLRYGVPDPDFEDNITDESTITIRSILKNPGDGMIYEYDFGDGWEHAITLKEITPYSHEVALPKCLDGERNCPPEDVGGPFGYLEFLKAYGDPGHPEHANMIEWAGDDFDPSTFDSIEINEFFRSWETAHNK